MTTDEPSLLLSKPSSAEVASRKKVEHRVFHGGGQASIDAGGVESLWECPCVECWHLAEDVKDADEKPQLYRDWKAERI